MNTPKLDEQNIKEINKKLIECLAHYRKSIDYMMADAPIEALCLDKTTQSILINAGCVRVYDFFDRDFTKIKGLGVIRIRDLTARLNEFLAVG